MSTANLPAIRACRPAWNKGRVVDQKRPLMSKHVWGIRVRREIAENHHDLAMFNLAIDSKLRGFDLVKLKVADVYAAGQVKVRASIVQSKTLRPVRFEITAGTRRPPARWMEEPLMRLTSAPARHAAKYLTLFYNLFGTWVCMADRGSFSEKARVTKYF